MLWEDILRYFLNVEGMVSGYVQSHWVLLQHSGLFLPGQRKIGVQFSDGNTQWKFQVWVSERASDIKPTVWPINHVDDLQQLHHRFLLGLAKVKIESSITWQNIHDTGSKGDRLQEYYGSKLPFQRLVGYETAHKSILIFVKLGILHT